MNNMPLKKLVQSILYLLKNINNDDDYILDILMLLTAKRLSRYFLTYRNLRYCLKKVCILFIFLSILQLYHNK